MRNVDKTLDKYGILYYTLVDENLNTGVEKMNQLDLSNTEGHTSGPWKIDNDGFTITSPSGQYIGHVGKLGFTLPATQTKANLPLVALAPAMKEEIIELRDQRTELLEALTHATGMLDQYCDMDCFDEDGFIAVETVLRKVQAGASK